MDVSRRLVFVNGERVELSKREFDLLVVLAENTGVVLSRTRLLELVWGTTLTSRPMWPMSSSAICAASWKLGSRASHPYRQESAT